MKKNIKKDNVVRAITIGLAAMMGVTGMPVNVLAADEMPEDEGSNAGEVNPGEAEKTEDQNTAAEVVEETKEVNIVVENLLENNNTEETVQAPVQAVNDEVEKLIENGFEPAATEKSEEAKDEAETAETSIADKAIELSDTVENAQTATNEAEKKAESASKSVNESVEADNKADEASTVYIEKSGEAIAQAENINNKIEEIATAIAEANEAIDKAETVDEVNAIVKEAKEQTEQATEEYNAAKEEYEKTKKAYEQALNDMTAADDEAAAKIEKAKEAYKEACNDLKTASDELTKAIAAAGEIETKANAAKSELEKAAGDKNSEYVAAQKEADALRTTANDTLAAANAQSKIKWAAQCAYNEENNKLPGLKETYEAESKKNSEAWNKNYHANKDAEAAEAKAATELGKYNEFDEEAKGTASALATAKANQEAAQKAYDEALANKGPSQAEKDAAQSVVDSFDAVDTAHQKLVDFVDNHKSEVKGNGNTDYNNLDKLNAKNDKLQAELDGLKAAYKAAYEANKNQSMSKEEAQAIINSNGTDAETLGKLLKDLEDAKVATITAKNNDDEAQGKVTAQKDISDAAQAKATDLRAKADEAYKAANAQSKIKWAAECAYNDAVDKVNELKEKYDKEAAENSRVWNINWHANKDAKAAENKAATLAGELEKAKADAEAYDALIEKANDANKAVVDAQKKVNDLQVKIAEIELDDHETNKQARDEAIKILKDQLEEANKKLDEAEQKKNAADEELEKAINKGDEKKSEIEEAEKKKAEEEAKKQAEEEAKKQAEEEAKKQAEEEAKKKAEEEAKKKNKKPAAVAAVAAEQPADTTPLPTPAAVTPIAPVVTDVVLPVSLAAPAVAPVATGLAAQVAGARVDEIGAALAEGEGENKKEDPVGDTKLEKPETEANEEVKDAEVVTIKDEEIPLAAVDLDEAKKNMNWWWLLIVALLGATGYEMYKKNEEKKALAEANKNADK